MPNCKNCQSANIIKSGKPNGKQRYHCINCGCHFVEGDTRTDESVAIKKALCIIFYVFGRCSFRRLAKIFKTSPSLVHRWVADSGCRASDPRAVSSIKEIKSDDICRFIKNHKELKGTKPITVVSGELLPGCSVVVLLQQSEERAQKLKSGSSACLSD